MKDAEYLFKQTEIERKKLGYGDKHKKRGGGKYVRLPSDHLTKKEREALNGEIKTWKQKPFYTREEFKNLSDDVQIQWVNSIINRYDAGMSSICRSVFKCNQTWLNNHFAGKGATEYINKASGGRAGEKGREKLEAAYTEWLNSGQPTLTEDNDGQRTLSTDDTVVVAHEKVTEKAPTSDTCENEPIKPVDKHDFHNIALLLQSLAGTGAKLTIEVTL